MLHLKIEINAKTPQDIEYILDQVRGLIREEQKSGLGNIDDGNYTFSITGEDETTWSLLVSNVGWVRQDCPDYNEVKRLYDEYVASKQYEQVTLWSSALPDPIEEYDKNEEEGQIEVTLYFVGGNTATIYIPREVYEDNTRYSQAITDKCAELGHRREELITFFAYLPEGM